MVGDAGGDAGQRSGEFGGLFGSVERIKQQPADVLAVLIGDHGDDIAALVGDRDSDSPGVGRCGRAGDLAGLLPLAEAMAQPARRHPEDLGELARAHPALWFLGDRNEDAVVEGDQPVALKGGLELGQTLPREDHQ